MFFTGPTIGTNGLLNLIHIKHQSFRVAWILTISFDYWPTPIFNVVKSEKFKSRMVFCQQAASASVLLHAIRQSDP